MVSWYSRVTIPAFMTSMSKRPPSRWNVSEKLITEEKSARSTFHTSHDLNPVADSMSGRDGYQEKARGKNKKQRTRKCSFTLALAATSENKFSWVHTCEMFCSFETDACVGADHHDGFSGQIGTLDGGDCGPLVDDKVKS